MRAVNTTVDYKTDIRMFAIRCICIPVHVLICRVYQAAYEYKSVIIELSIKMDPFFTFPSNIIKNFKF
jgi:hypothetical protein